MEQTVNLPTVSSVVRIHPCPPKQNRRYARLFCFGGDKGANPPRVSVRGYVSFFVFVELMNSEAQPSRSFIQAPAIVP